MSGDQNMIGKFIIFKENNKKIYLLSSVPLNKSIYPNMLSLAESRPFKFSKIQLRANFSNWLTTVDSWGTFYAR